MRITRTVHINAPLEQAFAVVDDDQKVMQWAEGVESITYLGDVDRSNPVGARFTQKIREGGRVAEYQGEVVAYDRPHHLAITLGSKQFTMRVDYRFTSTGPADTRLDYAAEMIQAVPLARVMGVLFSWLTRRILDKQMARLKALAEAGS